MFNEGGSSTAGVSSSQVGTPRRSSMMLNPSFTMETALAPPSSVGRSSVVHPSQLDDITMRESIEFEGLRGSIMKMTPSKRAAADDLPRMHGSQQFGEEHLEQSQELELEFGLGDDFGQDRSSLEIEVARRESSQRASLAGGFDDVSRLLEDDENVAGKTSAPADASLDFSAAELLPEAPARDDADDDRHIRFDDGGAGDDYIFNYNDGSAALPDEPERSLHSDVPFPEVVDFPSAAANRATAAAAAVVKRRAQTNNQQQHPRKRKLVKDSVTELAGEPSRQNRRDTSDIVVEVRWEFICVSFGYFVSLIKYHAHAGPWRSRAGNNDACHLCT